MLLVFVQPLRTAWDTGNALDILGGITGDLLGLACPFAKRGKRSQSAVDSAGFATLTHQQELLVVLDIRRRDALDFERFRIHSLEPAFEVLKVREIALDRERGKILFVQVMLEVGQ
jgi:hypothetical protein